MGTIYAIANQKGGVGKTTTAVNVAACIAEAGYATLLVDIDPQANATVGLGRRARRDAERLRRPGGAATRRGRARRRRAIDDLRSSPVAPRSGRRERRAAARAGLRAAPARGAGRACASASPTSLLDCPPSLGPLTVNALVAADRVIVPVQTEYYALEGLAGLLDTLRLDPARAQPAPDRRGHAADHARRRARAWRSDVEREVREHFPQLVFDTVIPRNVRIGEAPSFGRPVIHHDPHCAGCGGLLRAGQGGGRPWLSAVAGMGRGLAAILSRRPSRRASGGGRARASSRSSSIAPNPASRASASTTTRCRRLADSRRASAACCSRCSSARGRAGRYELDRRRAPLARRAARGPRRRCRRSSASATTRQSLEVALIENMAREDLNPIEEARAVRGARRGAGSHARGRSAAASGRSRVAVSNLLRLLDLPDEALALLEDGSLTEGHGRALLLRRRPRRPPPPRPRGGPGRVVGARRSSSAPARPTPRRAPPRARPRGGPSRPGDAAAARISEALGARPRHRGPRRARAAPATRSSSRFEDVDEALALARRSAPPSGRLILATIRAPQGRLAQSVRALL